MVDNSKEVRKQILSCIGSIAAAITIVTYLILAINSGFFPFLIAFSIFFLFFL